jgi:hypothetical protein
MLVLMIIVCVAVLSLMLSRADGRSRPVGLIAVGLLSLLLGGRAVALLSDSYSVPFISVVSGQQVSVDESHVSSELLEAEAKVKQHLETALIADVDAPAPAEESDVQAEVTNDDEMLDGVEEEQAPADSRELTIKPIASVKYLSERPDWVESKPALDGDVHQLAIASGPEVRKQAANRMLVKALKSDFDEYINSYLGSEYASTLVGYRISEAKKGDERTFLLKVGDEAYEIGREPFEELIEFPESHLVMNQSHLLVKIDQQVRDSLDHRWSEVHATCRLLQTGLGAGVVLLLLGTMFSYFRLDTATRGYYTGRLQFGAAAAILAVIAASVLFAKWIPWM